MNKIKFKASDPTLEDLQRQEQQLAAQEMELSLTDASLRGREATVSAQRSGLERRARWIDSRVESLKQWAIDSGVDTGDELVGLGDGAALREADVEAYVDRSKTLLVSRAATLAARKETLNVRRKQLEGREAEVEALEQAFIRAEVRLTARERMLMAANARLERNAAQARPGEEDAVARPVLLTHTTDHFRHAPTVTMTPDEFEDDEMPPPVTSRTVAGKPAPPVLEVGDGGHRRRSSSQRRAAQVPTTPRLTLADRPQRRSQLEVDRDGAIILLSLHSDDELPEPVDFVYFDVDQEVSHFSVELKLLMPTAGGSGNAAVLSASAWTPDDFENFDKVLSSLPS